MSLEAAAFPSWSEGILVPPSNGIDLKQLAKDTSEALEALEPFYTAGSKWYMVFGKNKEIASKVNAYAKAIDSSIEASGHGYTIATDAIDALNYILKMSEAKLDPQDKVLESYLQKTFDLAIKGLRLAEKARDDFQDVRKNIKKLIKAEVLISENMDATTAALEKFRNTLSQYVDWWLVVAMKHKSQRDRNDLQLNIIRQQGVLNYWKELQKDYVIYNKYIRELQDSNPDFFQRPKVLIFDASSIDLKKLANDTTEALKSLEPFCKNWRKECWFRCKHGQIVLKVQKYAMVYTTAIDSSIEASGHGYNIATDAIDALNDMLNIPEEKLDLREHFLKDYPRTTSALANTGLELPEKICDDFQDLHKNLKMLIETEGQDIGDMDATAALEKLRNTLSLYVDWWLEMGKKYETQKGRSDLPVSIIDCKGVLGSWKQLQEDYLLYNKHIRELKQSNPDLFQLPEVSIFTRYSNGINLKKLANDTAGAMRALEPKLYKNWCKGCLLRFKDNVALALKVEMYTMLYAIAYAMAIDSSIDASIDGWTIATDAIQTLNHVLKMPEEKLDPQDKVLIAYFQKTSDPASKALELAERARDDFQDVRKDLNELLQIGGQDDAENTDATGAALEMFNYTLPLYVDWWVEMGKKHKVLRDRSDLQLKITCQDILEDWKELQNDYVIYKEQIAAVRDSYDYILNSK